MESSTVEEYVEAIYRLEQQDDYVKSSRLAEQLGLSPPTVTEMLKRLTDKGLVTKTATQGISLTEKGNQLALNLLRKHRLSERFLTDVLGLPWDKVHDEACKLEHVLSEDVEEGLSKLLNEPESCPHGHPIPDRAGVISQQETVPLSNLRTNQAATIVNVHEEEPEMLQYLATLGLIPDASLTIEEIAPFGGPLLIKTGASRYAIGREVASKIMVKEREA